MPYHTIPCHTTLNHTIPYHTIPACIKHTTHPHINGHRLSRFSPIPNPLNKLPDHLILQPIKHTKGCLTQLSSCTKPVQPNIRCIHLNITSIKHTIHISGPALKLFSYTWTRSTKYLTHPPTLSIKHTIHINAPPLEAFLLYLNPFNKPPDTSTYKAVKQSSEHGHVSTFISTAPHTNHVQHSLQVTIKTNLLAELKHQAPN